MYTSEMDLEEAHDQKNIQEGIQKTETSYSHYALKLYFNSGRRMFWLFR